MIGALKSFKRRIQWFATPKLWRRRDCRGALFTIILIVGISSTAYFMVYPIHKNSVFTLWKTPLPVTTDSPLKINEHSNAFPMANSIVPDSVAVNIQKQINKPDENIVQNDMKNDEIEKEFKRQWFRMQKYRVDWKQIIAPCANNTVPDQALPGWGKENKTSFEESYVEYMEVRPAGQFSRFFIRTKTEDGRNKTIGGDFWKVILIGPATVAGTVFDHGNGSYEAVALIVASGKYELVAIVERTLCKGMKDPTPEFYTRLALVARRGRNPSNVLEPGCCLNGRLKQKIDITVLPSEDNVEERIKAVLKSNCSKSCSFIWSGLGRWIEKKWIPFLSSDNHHLSSLSRKQQTNDTIFIYGDSISRQFAKDLYNYKARNVCEQVWKRCKIDYFHLYPTKSKLHPNGLKISANIEYNELEYYGNSSKEFKPKIILDSIKDIFLEPEMKRKRSLLVLNLNVHYARSVTFAQYKEFIGNLTYLLKNRAKLFGSNARVVWRTATALNYRSIFNRYWSSKYLTSDRVLLYGAYALSEICKSGIDVLDVYPMSVATPLAGDRVHFQEETFYKAMDALVWYSLAGVNPRTEKICLEPSK